MLLHPFKTNVFNMFDITTLLDKLIEFLIKVRDKLEADKIVQKNLIEKQSILRTPFHSFTDMMLKILSKDFDKYVFLIDLTPLIKQQNINVPELLTQSFTDIDLFWIKTYNEKLYKVIEHLNFKDKMLLNLTNYIDKKGKIKDLNHVYGKLMLMFLTRSYLTTENIWLNPAIISKAATIYGSVIGYNIAKIFNLPYESQNVVGIILATYFCQKCVTQEGIFPSTVQMCSKFGSPITIRTVLRSMEQILGHQKELTLHDVVNLIVELGPERIKGFDISTFLHLGRAYHSNQLLSLLSLELPPIWMYNMLTAISGLNQSNMYWTLKKVSMIKETNELFMNISPHLFTKTFS